MAEPFLGEIRRFSFTFLPKNWASCDGTTLQVSQMTGLFSIIGSAYGGNGTTTFALPDLRESTPVGYTSSNNVGERVTKQTAGPLAFTTIAFAIATMGYYPTRSS